MIVKKNLKEYLISVNGIRTPVEMSFGLESMLPYHTATASALLTSMLSVSPRTYAWTLEGTFFNLSMLSMYMLLVSFFGQPI